MSDEEISSQVMKDIEINNLQKDINSFKLCERGKKIINKLSSEELKAVSAYFENKIKNDIKINI